MRTRTAICLLFIIVCTALSAQHPGSKEYKVQKCGAAENDGEHTKRLIRSFLPGHTPEMFRKGVCLAYEHANIAIQIEMLGDGFVGRYIAALADLPDVAYGDLVNGLTGKKFTDDEVDTEISPRSAAFMSSSHHVLALLTVEDLRKILELLPGHTALRMLIEERTALPSARVDQKTMTEALGRMAHGMNAEAARTLLAAGRQPDFYPLFRTGVLALSPLRFDKILKPEAQRDMNEIMLEQSPRLAGFLNALTVICPLLTDEQRTEFLRLVPRAKASLVEADVEDEVLSDIIVTTNEEGCGDEDSESSMDAPPVAVAVSQEEIMQRLDAWRHITEEPVLPIATFTPTTPPE